MADAQGAPKSHSAAALEGIALLKQGCKVQKYSQNHAKAKLTTFKLSDDERTLSWEGEGVGGMLSSLSVAAEGRTGGVHVARPGYEPSPSGGRSSWPTSSRWSSATRAHFSVTGRSRAGRPTSP